MPYPESPFEYGFDNDILLKLGNDDATAVNAVQKEFLLNTLSWLCSSPAITTFRVNTLKSDPKTVKDAILQVLGHGSGVIAEFHPNFREIITISHSEQLNKLEIYPKEIIVDEICASAILRGAHLYAPGVIGMMANIQIGDLVSIYADTAKKCRKGFLKKFEEPKIFIGNGRVKMQRCQLFSENPQNGIAVEIVKNIANCPPLGDNFLPSGSALLQNFPSIVCVHVLDPRPNETILDMCAAPGNKTTHIAALMHNKGKLFAIDKTSGKLEQLKRRCDEFGARVETLQADSSKLLVENRFPEGFFDRILLDAPCSALGKRPQLANTTKPKVLRSYVPLQRKLFQTAVSLLRNGGTLVYSTCTITRAENEGIVAWALENFPIELVEAAPIYGGPGLPVSYITDRDLAKMQRFGFESNQKSDSVGFFIAKFVKNTINK